MEKEAMEKRQKNETTKLKRKIEDINDESDRKLEEEREALQD